MIIFKIIKSLLIAVLFLFNLFLMPTLSKFHVWMCEKRQTNDFIWTLFWFYYPIAMIFIAPLGFINEKQDYDTDYDQISYPATVNAVISKDKSVPYKL